MNEPDLYDDDNWLTDYEIWQREDDYDRLCDWYDDE